MRRSDELGAGDDSEISALGGTESTGDSLGGKGGAQVRTH